MQWQYVMWTPRLERKADKIVLFVGKNNHYCRVNNHASTRYHDLCSM